MLGGLVVEPMCRLQLHNTAILLLHLTELARFSAELRIQDGARVWQKSFQGNLGTQYITSIGSDTSHGPTMFLELEFTVMFEVKRTF